MALGIVRDYRVGRARQADAAGQRAGVDPGEPDLEVALHPVVEAALGAEIARDRGVLAHDAADRAFDVGFDVLGIGADVADVRESEGYDLPGVGGIGHHLLVAGHRGVEADFTDRTANVAEALAPYQSAVREDQNAGRPLGLCRRVGGVGHGALQVRFSGDVC